MAKEVIAISIIDNTAEVIKATEEQIMTGMAAIGEVGEGFAKQECPVDTGRLRASISYSVVEKKDRVSTYIGTNVEYAIFVEYRNVSHRTGNAHFLRNAAANHGDEYKAILKAALSK